MVIEYSKIGEYHKEKKCENQDVIYYDENDNFQVISLADGVSACKKSKYGAEIVAKSITNLMIKKGSYFFDFSAGETAHLVLSHILYELKQCAKNNEDIENINEYSSTLACVVVDKKKKSILCFSLGDSIIMASGNGQTCIVTPPSSYSEDGCCVTTTKNADLLASVKIINSDNVESIMICSDGAWKKMYEHQKLKPEIKEILVNNRYDQLNKYLSEQRCFDDCSFIAYKMPMKNGR